MSKSESDNVWGELRKPFDPKSIGKITRGGVQLDYVGHAAVTDRLNTVEPTWTWEAMSLDESGTPKLIDSFDNFGKPIRVLWIRLTINGVTRPAVGDGKTEKEAIGDAIRNGAMRFGVALDLWSKDELESNIEHPENKNVKATAKPEPKPESKLKRVGDYKNELEEVSDRGRKMLVDHKIGGKEAVALAQMTIDKEKPETVEDWQELIKAMED